MSFRIEEKLLINKKQILEFEDFLFKKHAKKIFPSRKIQSLYFENFNEEMYKDSLEGIVPRKKIRVRNYPNDKKIKRNNFLWLRWENSCKQIRYKRFLLNSMAIKYNINPDNYKNKRLLVNAILDYWNNIFRINH